jgi:cullin-associated NEDD8-dissociated protein 1
MFVDQFRSIVDAKPKENAVKQEIERMDESRRGVVRLGLDAQRRYPEGLGQEWADWWNDVRKEHGQLLRALEAELHD